MTVVVTGATGQLAQYFIKYLQDTVKDCKIITTVRKPEDVFNTFLFKKNEVFFYIKEIGDMEEIIKDNKPDFFFNFAAFSNPRESLNNIDACYYANVNAVRKQLEAIKLHSPKTRYINAGSSEEIYGDNPYAISKRESRKVVREYRKEHNIFAIQPTIFNFTSNLQSTKFIIPKVISEVKRIKSFLDKGITKFPSMKVGNIHMTKHFLWVEDVVKEIWCAANQENLLLNAFLKDVLITTEEFYFISEIIELIFRMAGIEGYWTKYGETEVFESERQILAFSDILLFRDYENKLSNYVIDDCEFLNTPKTDIKAIISKMLYNT